MPAESSPADVAAMDDVIAAGKEGQGFGAQEVVGVGDEGDAGHGDKAPRAKRLQP